VLIDPVRFEMAIKETVFKPTSLVNEFLRRVEKNEFAPAINMS